MRKLTKKPNTKRSPEHKFGVLMENIESQLKLVAEGHGILANSVNRLREEMNERFSVVDQKFDIVFDELHLIHNELKEKISRDEFVVLEKRVTVLERNRHQK